MNSATGGDPELGATASPPGVVLEEAACPLGCEAADEPVLRGSDWIYGLPGSFAVVRCVRCGLMRTSPRPTADTIGFYYPSNYGPHAATTDSPLGSRGWKSRIRELFEFNTERLPDLPPGRMLEVGCATGTFLQTMRARGWDVSGIERSEAATRIATNRGLSVLNAGIEEAAIIDDSFDLIVAWMALEHFHEPVQALRRLRGWIRPDGWLAASVPDASALGFRLFGPAWYALGLPVHLFHFTPKTLRLVLEKSGWQLVAIHQQRVLNNILPSLGRKLSAVPFLRNASRALIRYPERTGYHNYVMYPLALSLALAGQTGAITFWARPK
jgi:2-polyprenyl-3-methyl-5-hydroxy-6-metoxy-1,4-benzoquinol methylase